MYHERAQAVIDPAKVVTFNGIEHLSDEYLKTLPAGTVYAFITTDNKFNLMRHTAWIYQRSSATSSRDGQGLWATDKRLDSWVFTWRWTACRWAKKRLSLKAAKPGRGWHVAEIVR